jgi:hypothetical protein
MNTGGDLEARIAATEARMTDIAQRLGQIEIAQRGHVESFNRIEATLKTMDVPAILQQQNSVNNRHGELLAKLKREQDSLRKQTGSMSADIYEAWRPAGAFLGFLGVIAMLMLLMMSF